MAWLAAMTLLVFAVLAMIAEKRYEREAAANLISLAPCIAALTLLLSPHGFFVWLVALGPVVVLTIFAVASDRAGKERKPKT